MKIEPSTKMHLAQQGFSDIAILDFDLAVNDFGDEFERALNATKMVPAKKAKRRPMVPEALYDDVQLKRFLSFPDDIIGIRPDDDPELNTLVDDLLTGKADWLLPELPKPNVPE